MQGKQLSVDGSFVEGQMQPRRAAFHGQQLAEAAQVHHAVHQYVQELEQQVALQSFVDRYLSTEALGIAYNLEYI